MSFLASRRRGGSCAKDYLPATRRQANLLARTALLNKLDPLLTGKPDGQVAAIIGEEGAGKSWLVATELAFS